MNVNKRRRVIVNNTIETILDHRSIRKFKEKELTDDQVRLLVKAAQQASTSSYVMAYTIIGITDKNKKEELWKISGHNHVTQNGHLFIFCGDLHRVMLLAEEENEKILESVESKEQFIVATIDAAVAAQNLCIAAESMGLGICYLGSLRNDIYRFNDVLELPDHVFPLFGIAVGYPDEEPELKPRLPIEAVYHENVYSSDDIQKSILTSFDQEIANYYESRSTNKRTDTWSEQMMRKYSNPTRLNVADFIKSKKLDQQ